MDAILCQKTISTVSRYSIPFLLHSFNFQCHCLGAVSDPAAITFFSAISLATILFTQPL